MARLSIAIGIAVFMVLILNVCGTKKTLNKRDTVQVEVVQNDDALQWFCQNNPFAVYFSVCDQYSTTTVGTSTSTSAYGMTGSTTNSFTLSTTTQDSSSSPASSLERAHWCGFSNGSYIPLGFTFMYTACALCQCTQSHVIRCNNLQCMPTYCIDNSVPSTRAGQCCSQCAYDTNSTSCIQNGVTFPHGTILKSTPDNIQCWCQLGSVECRKTTVSGSDLWGDGTGIYIVIVVLCVLLIIGTLLCGGCTLVYYYYYRRNQLSAEHAYGQYWNNAGWQPMGEEEQGVDGDADKKQTEAEQGPYEQEYPTGHSEEYIPPPYALYNGTFVNEQPDKNQKQI